MIRKKYLFVSVSYCTQSRTFFRNQYSKANPDLNKFSIITKMSNIEEANKEKVLANEFLSKKMYKEALEHYSKAVSLNPNDHIHFSNRSACYASMSEFDKALEDASKCVQIKPDWAKGYSRKGLAEFNLGKLDEAESSYKKGLELDPSNAQLQEGLDAIKREREAPPPFDFSKLGGQFPGFNAFAGGAGGNSDFYNQALLKLLLNKDTMGYLQDDEFMKKVIELKQNPMALQKYKDDPKIKKAMEVISNEMDLDVGDLSKFTKSDKASASEDKPAEKPAEKPVEKPAEKKPEKMEKEPTISEEKLHKDHEHEHEHHHHHHEHKQTKPEPKPEAKVETKPSQPKVSAAAEEEKNKGNDEYKKRNFPAALAHYDKAIELDPNEGIYYNNKAAVYMEMKEYDKALECCDKAIGIIKGAGQYDYVKFAKVLARKASAYTQLEQFDQAISYFNQSLLENADPKVKDEMKKVEKLKKDKEAVSYINPEISEQHRVNGNQLYGEGKYPEAIKEYEEAIKRNPKDAKLYANKATALMKLLEHPSALIEINKCLDLDPNYVKGWAKKGVIHQAMKEYHKALEAFEKGIKIDPENEECKKGLDNVRANIMMGQYTESKEEAEERLRHAMADPEIQNILRDPSVNEFLRNIQERPNDPTLLGGLKDPHLSAKINKLIAAGVLKTG